MYLEDYRAEAAAFEALDVAIEIIVTKCGVLRRMGDGNCGGIMLRITERLIDSGLMLTDEQLRKERGPSKSKRVLPHWLKRQVMERDKYRCLHCGTHLNLSVDHIIAESNGGSDDPENLQTLCVPCNSSKGTK